MTINLDHYKAILLEYLQDGKIRQPSDFDRDVTGISVNPFNQFIFLSNPSDTPFGHALTALIDEGKVKCWFDDEGWKYQISTKSRGACA